MCRMKPIELDFDQNQVIVPKGNRVKEKGDILGTSYQEFPIAILTWGLHLQPIATGELACGSSPWI